MGKIILEFDSAEEQEDARTALDGYKWKIAMWDLDQHLRGQLKYNACNLKDAYEELETLREKLRDILNDYNLKL